MIPIEKGKQVKILSCCHNEVPIGTYGIVEDYLPNYDGYTVKINNTLTVYVEAEDIDIDPQQTLNI